MDDVETWLRLECRMLARDLVRMDEWARRAHGSGHWWRAAGLQERRDVVREHRSSLLRELWTQRRDA